ncbi:MAG: hypothetical protein C4K47_05130 [Candidatus Thorarchaeota archaeon]|nr:MAG: hypothetical protein C4K47_05130 [Candidatus Thorarchaeota archaeon]
MANKNIVVSLFVVFLVASFAAFAQTTLPQSNNNTQTIAEPIGYRALADWSGSSALMREYLLPAGSPATTYVPSAGPSYPTAITYDANGFIWFTDIFNNRVYRLTPATAINQTSTTALKWQLPLFLNMTRGPAHIIVDDAHTSVWFTDYVSMQISCLNWTTNLLRDWTIPRNLNIHPWDLLMDPATGHIWFTGLNSSRFCELIPPNNALIIYNLIVMGDTGGPLPVSLAEMKPNGPRFYMTDFRLDFLYRVQFMNPGAGASVFPLVPGGSSLALVLDSKQDVWVSQPASDFVNEQLTGSNYKKTGSITSMGTTLEDDMNVVAPNSVNIPIHITPVRAAEYTTPPQVIGDPLNVWNVPSSPSGPWGIDTDTNDSAWYAEYTGNQIGMITPSTNKTLEFMVPTTNSHPLYLTVPRFGMPPYATHVWFTEFTGGKVGELFTGTFVDVRAAPSIPPQYPPPNPGSIRWTAEPGAEIWIDAPSNGFSSAHHDIPERGVVNHLYARVANLGFSAATNINVKFYYHNMSVAFAEFVPLPPSTPSVTVWFPIGSTTIASLAPSLSTDVYVEWTINSTVPDHFCIGVQVYTSGDINLYDNVAYRNFEIFSVLAGVPTTLYLPVWATNFLNATGTLSVSLSGVPDGWTAVVKPNGVSVGPGKSTLLNLTIQVPSSAKAGMRAVIEVTGMIDGTTTGMLWVEVDVVAQTTTQTPPISTLDVGFLAGGFVAGVVLMLLIRRRGK